MSAPERFHALTSFLPYLQAHFIHDKAVIPQGPFSSCSGAHGHPQQMDITQLM